MSRVCSAWRRPAGRSETPPRPGTVIKLVRFVRSFVGSVRGLIDRLISEAFYRKVEQSKVKSKA